MRRPLAIMLLAAVAACGSKAKKDACDESKRPTQEWAWSAYKKAGGDYTYEEGTALLPDERNRGVYELIFDEGSADAPRGTLGYVWKCAFWRDQDELATALLLDRGWKAGDAAKRAELATAIDERFFGSVVAEQPEHWNARHPFKAPETSATPDGGVKRTRWLVHHQHIWGGSIPNYDLVDITFGADAKVTRGKSLDHFEMRGGSDLGTAGVPPCDPAAEPTDQQAFEVWAKAQTGAASDSGFQKMAGRLPGVYGLTRVGKSMDDTESLGFLWRCVLYPDEPAVVKQFLLDSGWKDGDAAKREALANQVDDAISSPMTYKTNDFDDAHTFTPPATRSLPDGSVERTRWLTTMKSLQGPIVVIQEKITFAPDGTYEEEILDQFEVKP
jgi:hypothetical protein